MKKKKCEKTDQTSMQTYRVRTKKGRITIRSIQVPERKELIVHFSKKTDDSQIRGELRDLSFSFRREGEIWYSRLNTRRMTKTEAAIKSFIKRNEV